MLSRTALFCKHEPDILKFFRKATLYTFPSFLTLAITKLFPTATAHFLCRLTVRWQ